MSAAKNIPLLDDPGWKGSVARFAHRFGMGLVRLSESRIALVGLIITVIVVLIAIFAPVLATHNPIKGDYSSTIAPPSRQHLLGTDNLGRDIWSRLVYGARNAVLVGITVVPAGMLMGIFLGAIPGFYGGRLDNLMMRFVDAWLAFPGLILFLALLAVLGQGLWQTIVALILGGTPGLVRLTRGLVLAERERDYVKAARLLGERNWRILFRQVIPNVSSPLIVVATIRLGGTLLLFAALTFLGLGPPPPAPSWGLMLNEARNLMETAPMVAVYPGLAIFITVLGVNLLGDGLRDVLDPRLAEK